MPGEALDRFSPNGDAGRVLEEVSVRSLRRIGSAGWLVVVLAGGCGGGSDGPGDGDAGLEDARDGADDGGLVEDGDAGLEDARDGADDGGLVEDGDAGLEDARDGADDGGLVEDGDAGEGDQAGDDGGIEPSYELSLVPLEGWQRGPVRVELLAAGPAGERGDVSLAYSLDGQAFAPATALVGTLAGARDLPLEPGGVSGRFVWDSKADVDQDVLVWLRASLRVGGAVRAQAELGPIDLHDALDFDRPGLVTHFYAGRASLLWLRTDGSLEDSGLDLPTPERPSQAAFTADGRFGVVLSEGAGGVNHKLSPFQVARDGSISALGPELDIQALGLMGSDLAPAPDGSGLWISYRTGQGGLFFLSFEGGVPALAVGPGGDRLLVPMTLAACLALLPDNRRAVVSGGALVIDDPPFDLTLVDLQARTILDQVVLGAGSLADTLSVSSSGAFALVPAADPWGSGGGHRVFRVALEGDALGAAESVEVRYPARAVIHPEDTAALVTSWDADRVFVLDLTASPPALAQTLTVSLADHVACVREGALSGLCLVSSVSALLPIRLGADATAVRGTPLGFGEGNESIVYGSAFQP
jgi:hypothetical protein